MAIDTTIFAADLPAGAYTAGQVIPLGNIAGPANVRSGRGAAHLKNVFVGALIGTAGPYATVKVHVKNSDWVDDVVSIPSAVNFYTSAIASCSPESGLSQTGHDCELTPNSGWQVYAEICDTVTTTTASSFFALIDIDYPSVSAVQDPRQAVGTPASMSMVRSLPVAVSGAMSSATWTIENVDYFKAGSKYCLEKVEFSSGYASTIFGFIAFSNAAGMGGLQRIIPVVGITDAIKYPIKYASTLVKGPMDVKYMLFADTAGTANVHLVHDYVKRNQ